MKVQTVAEPTLHCSFFSNNSIHTKYLV